MQNYVIIGHQLLPKEQVIGSVLVNFSISSSVSTLFSISLLYTLDAQGTAVSILMEITRTPYNATGRHKSH